MVLSSKLFVYKNFRYSQIRYLISTNGKWIKTEDNVYLMPEILKKIESHWKPIIDDYWKEILKNNVKNTDPKSRYILSMFPYPSGSLHLGHIRIYTTSDVLTNLSHICGYSVIHPIGFDSFGLPAENAALHNSIDPSQWTRQNIDEMKKQLNLAGYQFNWRQSTSDPSYYKWTQWLFVQLFKSDLAYKGMGFVNWDPIDCTVLADEQVDDTGRSWRSGAVVERRCHRQWFIKTNSFANDLFQGTDINKNSGHWENIILHQQHWIGKPSGHIFYLNYNNEDILPIFTSFPELFLHDKSFIGVSKNHWLIKTQRPLNIINPFTNKQMDIKIVEHELPLSTQATVLVKRESFQDVDAREKVVTTSQSLKLGGYYTSPKYRDWLVSRQRYWGTPIPIVYCNNCGVQPVCEQDLPVELPKISDWESLKLFKSDGVSNPIEKLAPKEWLYTKCPKCSQIGKRETETLDTFFDSSWYFLRYASNPIDNSPFDKNCIRPTWSYVGGKEHSALHLFYARFVTHFLHHKGFIHFREPFSSLLMQSIVKGKTYKVNGKYITPEQASTHQNVVVEYEKMSKSKGNGVNPDLLIQKYGCDATRWCILSDGNPKRERLWDSNDEKEYYETLVFLRRVWLTMEEYLAVRQKHKYGRVDSELSYVRLLHDIPDDKVDKAIYDLRYSRQQSIIKMLSNFDYTYQYRNGITALHTFLSIIRQYSRTNIALTDTFDLCLGSFIIMMSPLTPHLSAECWTAFVSLAHHNQQHYHINKSILYQKFPQIDKSIPFEINFFNNKNKFVSTLKVDWDKIKEWTEKEIMDIIDIDDEIDMIHIKKGLEIRIYLKNDKIKNKFKLKI